MLTVEKLKHAQIPSGYWDAQWDKIPDVKLAEAVRRYAADLPRFRRAGLGLLLTGGDTVNVAAASLLRAVLDGGYSAFHVEASSVQRAVIERDVASHDEVGQPVGVIDYATVVDFLWLDGLGLEYSGGDEFARSVLENLLHARDMQRRPTFVTSYLRSKAVIERYRVLPIHVSAGRMVVYEVRGA